MRGECGNVHQPYHCRASLERVHRQEHAPNQPSVTMRALQREKLVAHGPEVVLSLYTKEIDQRLTA